MHAGGGISLILAGDLVGVVTVFALWRRIRAAAAFALMIACGVAVGAGGLLVQERAGAGEWAVTLAALGATTPVHARLVFGPPRRG